MKRPDLNTISAVAGLVAVAAAVAHELRLPPGQRTGHGRVLGVPYDFRRPTWARARAALWSPEDPRLMMPRIFGVGWTPNLGRVTALLEQLRHRSS